MQSIIDKLFCQNLHLLTAVLLKDAKISSINDANTFFAWQISSIIAAKPETIGNSFQGIHRLKSYDEWIYARSFMNIQRSVHRQ